MKVWYDKDKINLTRFISENILLLPLFNSDVVGKDNDFKNNLWGPGIEKIIEYTDINSADYILYHNKLDTDIFKFVQDNIKYAHKPILVFYNDDNPAPLSEDLPDNVFVFKTSIYKSQQRLNEIALPAWSSDFTLGNIITRKKDKKPVVSFCGAITHPDRKKVIKSITGCVGVNSSFVVRDSFWGGRPHDNILRNEYKDNMLQSDMVLCVRGAGNFSYRLYECLSMGRVPVIIDTDISLPCSDVIDWSRFIVTDVNNVCSDIINFWANMSNDDYINLQQYSRYVYDEYISPLGFVRYINNHQPIRTYVKSSGMGLYNLLKDKKFIKGVEIGCYDCVNATFLLETLPELHLTGIDPYIEFVDWDGTLQHTTENALIKYARPLEERFSNRFKLHQSTSDMAVDAFTNESLDFVFVDGLHTYDQTLKDCINYLPKIKKGGIICGHDYNVIPAVTRAVNEFSDMNKKTPKDLKSTTRAWYWVKD